MRFGSTPEAALVAWFMRSRRRPSPGRARCSSGSTRPASPLPNSPGFRPGRCGRESRARCRSSRDTSSPARSPRWELESRTWVLETWCMGLMTGTVTVPRPNTAWRASRPDQELGQAGGAWQGSSSLYNEPFGEDYVMYALREVLAQAQAAGAAIGHFNVADLVLLKAVFASARELKVPVLVGASEGEREFSGTGQLAALVSSLREEFDFPIFLNADHTHSLAKAVDAVKAGFDAVVFDLSALPFEQNVRQTREAVEALKGINPSVLVEGEIGDIGTGSEIHARAPDLSHGLTTPDDARQFVESTGIDILAPAVGNMHGMLESMVHGDTRKRLDIERIRHIKAAARVVLTLHGGSGTDDDDLRKAIAAGVNIVHINTELRVAWRRGLEDGLAKQPDEVVPYRILPAAVDAVKKVAGSRLKLFSEGGKLAFRG